MKGISCCGDCGYYSWEKHKCTRCESKDPDPRTHFFADCPLPDVVEVEPPIAPQISGSEELPTVDAAPVVHAHYVKGSNGEWYCSNCKRIDEKYSVARYCWYCGAKMNDEGM